MNILKIISLLFTALILLTSGCGQGIGTDIVGVTGGSDDGYGSRTDIEGTTDSPADGVNQDLIGSWRNDIDYDSYMILTFYSNGTYEIEYYYQGQLYITDGTYTVSGNSITLDGEDTGTYSISGDTLTINIDGEITYFYRL